MLWYHNHNEEVNIMKEIINGWIRDNNSISKEQWEKLIEEDHKMDRGYGQRGNIEYRAYHGGIELNGHIYRIDQRLIFDSKEDLRNFMDDEIYSLQLDSPDSYDDTLYLIAKIIDNLTDEELVTLLSKDKDINIKKGGKIIYQKS